MEPEFFLTSTPSCLLEWVYKLTVSAPGRPQLTLSFSSSLHQMRIEPLLRTVLGHSWVQPGWTEAGAGEAPPQHPISPEAEFPEDSVYTALWSLPHRPRTQRPSPGRRDTGPPEVWKVSALPIWPPPPSPGKLLPRGTPCLALRALLIFQRS